MKKIILRLSNEIGNQMFMYASAYSISKKMNRNLFLDNETAFLSKKNVSKYGLYNFNITSPIIEDKLKFKNKYGYIKRKFLLKTEFLRHSKKFFIEKKDRHKITFFDEKFINNRFDDAIYLEGHFESPKYFINYQNDIVNEFKFKDEFEIVEEDAHEEDYIDDDDSDDNEGNVPLSAMEEALRPKILKVFGVIAKYKNYWK